MPFRYSSEFRHRMCERMLAGEAFKDLAAEVSVSDATLYKWRRQALIDVGRRPGAKSFEADPLVAARPHPRARGRARAGEDGQRAVRGGEEGQPKRKYQVVRGLNNL